MATQDLKPVITAMDTLNLQVMVNLSGRTGEDLVKAQENANTNYPGRFVLFCNIDFEGAGANGTWATTASGGTRTEVVVDASERNAVHVDPGLLHIDIDIQSLDGTTTTKAINVLEEVLYVLDVDITRMLPELNNELRSKFRLPEVLPGGDCCLMGQMPPEGAPFMGARP